MYKKFFVFLMFIISLIFGGYLLQNNVLKESKNEPSLKQSDVIIYSKFSCPYCKMAKSLLDEKGIKYKEIDIVEDKAQRALMVEKSNGKMTVPQIFINNIHIGGFDDLMQMDEKGDLDALLWFYDNN